MDKKAHDNDKTKHKESIHRFNNKGEYEGTKGNWKHAKEKWNTHKR